MLKKIICIVILNVCVAFLCCSCSKEYDSYKYIDKMYNLEQHEEYQIDLDTAVAIGRKVLLDHIKTYQVSLDLYEWEVNEYDECYQIAATSYALHNSICVEITKDGKFYELEPYRPNKSE